MLLIRNPRRFPSACYLLVLTLALLVVSTAAPSQTTRSGRRKRPATPTSRTGCGAGCAGPRRRRRRTACCAASRRSATTSYTAAIHLRKGSWTMFEARSTSTVCTKNQWFLGLFTYGLEHNSNWRVEWRNIYCPLKTYPSTNIYPAYLGVTDGDVEDDTSFDGGETEMLARDFRTVTIQDILQTTTVSISPDHRTHNI